MIDETGENTGNIAVVGETGEGEAVDNDVESKEYNEAQRKVVLECCLAQYAPEWTDDPAHLEIANRYTADAFKRLKAINVEVPPIEPGLVREIIQKDIFMARYATSTDAPGHVIARQILVSIEAKRNEGNLPEQYTKYPFTDEAVLAALAETYRIISDRTDEGIDRSLAEDFSEFEIITSILEKILEVIDKFDKQITTNDILGILNLLPSQGNKPQKPWQTCSKNMKKMIIKITREITRNIPGATLTGDKVNSTEGPVITLP